MVVDARVRTGVTVAVSRSRTSPKRKRVFADGLTDEMIRNLSPIEGVTVPSRASSFAIRGQGLSTDEAGRRLGADYLVEGSVLHAGDRCASPSRWSGPARASRLATDSIAR